MVHISAESNLLDPLDLRTYIFQLSRICCKTHPSYIYHADPGHGSIGSDFFETSFFTFHSLCKVVKKPITNHTKAKKISVVSPFGWQIELQLFQRCGPAFNKSKNTEAQDKEGILPVATLM